MSLGKWWILFIGLIHFAAARFAFGIASSENWNRFEAMDPDVKPMGVLELVCTSLHKVLDFPLTYAALKWTKSNNVAVASYFVNSLLWAVVLYLVFSAIMRPRRR